MTAPHVGDKGQPIIPLPIVRPLGAGSGPVDLSDAESAVVLARPPGGELREWPAELWGDGTGGRIVHYTVSGDLDVPGRWTIQARVELPGGPISGPVGPLEVYPVLGGGA
jgi:hypothetical protein